MKIIVKKSLNYIHSHPSISETMEQSITDLEIMTMEHDQSLTDLEIDVLELQEASAKSNS